MRYAGAIAFGVLVSARASFCLDNKNRKLLEFFNEDLPKTAAVPPTDCVVLCGKAYTRFYTLLHVCVKRSLVLQIESELRMSVIASFTERTLEPYGFIFTYFLLF